MQCSVEQFTKRHAQRRQRSLTLRHIRQQLDVIAGEIGKVVVALSVVAALDQVADTWATFNDKLNKLKRLLTLRFYFNRVFLNYLAEAGHAPRDQAPLFCVESLTVNFRHFLEQ